MNNVVRVLMRIDASIFVALDRTLAITNSRLSNTIDAQYVFTVGPSKFRQPVGEVSCLLISTTPEKVLQSLQFLRQNERRPFLFASSASVVFFLAT